MQKIQKKLKRHQHVLAKETGVICVSSPTKHLGICNVGLVNGLSEETIIHHFGKCGQIEDISLIPGKSCCFVSYKNVESANVAYLTFNGLLGIAQNQKPIYLAYVETVPNFNLCKVHDHPPPGLIILDNFISEAEENALLSVANFSQNIEIGNMKHRRVKHYGFEFRYDTNNIDKDKPLDNGIPHECSFLWSRLKERINLQFSPDQLTINCYEPGQGIPHHIDTHSAFIDPIVSLSLGSSVVMDFKQENIHNSVLLPRHSLAVISGESRYNWTHGITPRKHDVVYTDKGCNILQRSLRISYTFRKINTGECECIYKTMCDSYLRNNHEFNIGNEIAAKLERTHVHDVYENIAVHFSDTRHKPWPNVEKFVHSLDTGSILIDVGCGNGKYLGINSNIFNVGCDRSFNLVEVCRERKIESFTCDCLYIPLKDGMADAVICIAVLHHLANEERRSKAINEIIRVLKVNGRGLIYVWAKDQMKDKKKSNYLKQDSEKPQELVDEDKLTNEVSVINGVQLPIHTNRTQFKHQDLLVPWKLKEKIGGEEGTFLRFYHVFESSELEKLCRTFSNIEVIQSYYDQGNWCIMMKKINK